jgi:hypothetical protein
MRRNERRPGDDNAAHFGNQLSDLHDDVSSAS